jgi:hypothetical protein
MSLNTRRGTSRLKMKSFTIDNDNNITAFALQQEAETAAHGQSFASQDELGALTESWPMHRFVAVWNSFAGVAGLGADLKPLKKFENRDKAVARIWKALERLSGRATEEDTESADVAPTTASVAPANTKPTKKTIRPKKAPKTPKGSKPAKPTKCESGTSRDDSKKAKVISMLQRKYGATLSEIMEKMGWRAHTVRGFMAGALKGAGYEVESFKPEGGERTYRINSK